MILKNDENEVILINESLHLYDITTGIQTESTTIINGKPMTVKEFREMKNNDPNKGRWGRKAKNEMDDELV